MDIRAVDLNLLKAFDALTNERAVTRAAGRIGLSQPAMSHALSRLRDLFAADLFVRTPTGMEPTARAREIAPLVAAAIEHIEAALNLGVGFDPAKSAGIFTAGMAEYAEVALVGRLAAAFANQAPRATLRLTPLTGADAAEQLDRGMIDVSWISGCAAGSRCWLRLIWRCRSHLPPPISSPRCRAGPRARSPLPPKSKSCRCRSTSRRPCRWPGTAAPPASPRRPGSGRCCSKLRVTDRV
jgi:DNA-binding transcriptional LysR family regulator